MPLKDIEIEFTSSTEQVISAARLSHKVEKGFLAGSAKSWIKKEAHRPSEARLELLAQEFFRLIIPHQGETRLLENKNNGVHYILSEEVIGYRSLPINEAHHFISGHYQGLGQVLLCAMFLQESDLKNGNLGLDAKGKVHKIDGDWCFSEGRYKYYREYRLTSDAIAMLPYPKDFYAYHWLDLKIAGVSQIDSALVNPELICSPQFRLEVNQALLKILLLPDHLIDRFVDACTSAGGEHFLNIIKGRVQQLHSSALNDTSFQDYLCSSQARIDSKEFINYINLFHCHNGIKLVPEGKDAVVLVDAIEKQFANLNVLANDARQLRRNEDQIQVSTLIEKNQRSIANLEALAMIDTIESTLYIFELRQLIKNKVHGLDELLAMNDELTTKLRLCQYKLEKKSKASNMGLVQGPPLNTDNLLFKTDIMPQSAMGVSKTEALLKKDEIKVVLSTSPRLAKKNWFFSSAAIKVKKNVVADNKSQNLLHASTLDERVEKENQKENQKKNTLRAKTLRAFNMFNNDSRIAQAEETDVVVQKNLD